MAEIQTIVFDLGGVLIDWNPRYLYRKLLKTATEIEFFLNNICTAEWNAQQDAGRTFRDGVTLLQKQHPHYIDLIAAYETRWEEMLGGADEATVEILRAAKKTGMPVFALTNWSAETFPVARKHYEFLSWFDGIVVSGEERIRKPDRAIFNILLERYKIEARRTVYIDDVKENILAAAQVGLHAIHFQNAVQLRAALHELGISNMSAKN